MRPSHCVVDRQGRRRRRRSMKREGGRKKSDLASSLRAGMGLAWQHTFQGKETGLHADQWTAGGAEHMN